MDWTPEGWRAPLPSGPGTWQPRRTNTRQAQLCELGASLSTSLRKSKLREEAFAEDNEEEDNLVRTTMLFQSAVAAKPQDRIVAARLADMRGHQQREGEGRTSRRSGQSPILTEGKIAIGMVCANLRLRYQHGGSLL